MTTLESFFYIAIGALLVVAIIVGVWLCFRRTRVRGFLFLGVVLVLWPWFDAGTKALFNHFLDQVMRGQKPWLFPFSLMYMGYVEGAGWQMLPGEFLCKFEAAKNISLLLLLAVAFAFIARSLKREVRKSEDGNSS
jgi:hypothetical protein